MGNFTGSLACVGDSTVWFLISKEPAEFGHCIQDFNQQGQSHVGPKVIIREVEYQNSVLCSAFGATWNSMI